MLRLRDGLLGAWKKSQNNLFGFWPLRRFTSEMTESRELLAQYANTGSEAAFGELVTRYINLVYSTALRLVGGDTQLAEDVTQTAFINLARVSNTLSNEVMLGGWLHQHTFHLASTAARGERRRKAREREVSEMNRLQDTAEAGLRDATLLLDEAITQLPSEDRTAILLRFFEQLDFRSVGEALGTSEDSARMRVNRAVDKLYGLLKKRGVTTSAAALGTALTSEAVTAAPAGLAAAVTAAALSATTIATTTAIGATKAIVMTTLQKTGITAVIAVAVGAGIYEARQAANVREQNRTLRGDLEQFQQLRAELEESKGARAQAASDEVVRLRKDNEDLLRLRNQVGQLRAERQQLAEQVQAAQTQANASPSATPTARFGSYIDAVGNGVVGKSSQATFEFENPSESLVICAFHQPDGPRDMITGGPRDAFISIQPNSTNRVVLRVGQTNAETLSVKVMRVVSSRELSVPVP